mgnify:FL=1|tara:strand:+ start:564 stop:1025 length:462 start_codon:yes stop_codon:yes gene_type:complete
MDNEIAVKELADKIEELENSMYELFESGDKNVVVGNSDMFPLHHSFSEGVYIREMLMPKDGLIVGKIFKCSHHFILLKGKLLITMPGEETKIHTAPSWFTCTSNVRRVLLSLEDSVFMNVLPNPDNETSIDILEERLLEDNYKIFKENKELKQ